MLFNGSTEMPHLTVLGHGQNVKAKGPVLTILFQLRACLKIARGAAARDFGFGQGGEEGASPKRAVPTEPTPGKDKRPAAGRFSRTGPSGFVAPQSKTHEGYSPSSRLASQPFSRKQHPLEFSDRLLRFIQVTWHHEK